jgi:phosphoglycerate-specific signal transduction histidine kinase
MDQQLFELIEELKRLIPVLKSMSSTRGTEDSKSNDRGSDRIVNALARLTATIDTNNKTKAQQERSMEKFTSEVDKATDAQIELRKAQEDAIKSAEIAAKETTELSRRASLTQKQGMGIVFVQRFPNLVCGICC